MRLLNSLEGEPLHLVSDHLGLKAPIATATIYAHLSNEQGEIASNTFANASNIFKVLDKAEQRDPLDTKIFRIKALTSTY